MMGLIMGFRPTITTIQATNLQVCLKRQRFNIREIRFRPVPTKLVCRHRELEPKAMNSEKEDEPLEEIGDSSNVLDLTSYQLHSLDTVELPPTLIELDLTANRLSGLDSRIAQLSTLKKLSLRQNLIDDSAVEPLSHWDTLSDLEVILHSLIFLLNLRSDFVIGEISQYAF